MVFDQHVEPAVPTLRFDPRPDRQSVPLSAQPLNSAQYPHRLGSKDSDNIASESRATCPVIRGTLNILSSNYTRFS